MKIKTKELHEALTIVRPGLASKEILDQTTSFAFLKDRIVTYNDEISISHPFNSGMEGAIKAEELYGLLAKIHKEELDVQLKETELLLTAGRVKAGLRLETLIALPLKELPKKMHAFQDAKQFREFVGMAMRNCSSDATQPRLTCVYIREDGTVIGSDGYRLVSCQGSRFPVENFLLPARNAVHVVKLNPTHVALEKGWAHFKNKAGTTISCRRMDDDYVPEEQVNSVLKFKNKGKVKFPEKINDIIERVYPFAKRDSVLDEIVDVIIEGGKMTLKAKSASTNSWIEEKSPIECKQDIKFQMTPTLFREVMEVTKEAVFDESMFKMKLVGEGWEYVLMLRQD